MNRKRFALAAAGVGILAASLGLAHTGPTLASWAPTSNYHNATINSGTVNTIPALSCNAASGLIAVSIALTWTAPTSGLVPTGYTMSWSGTAGSGSTTVSGLTANVTVAGLAAGSLTVKVTSNFAASGITWTSPISTVTRTVTLISALGVIASWTCS